MTFIDLPRVLDAVRISLESRLDELNRNLILFTSAVVVGLWLEYVPEFLEKAARSGASRGFSVDRLANANIWYPRWMKRLEVLGAILVVGGVSGELHSEFSRVGIDNSLKELSGVTLAIMQQQSSAANERAAAANKEAGAAQKDAGAAILQASRLGIEAEVAQKETAILQRDNLTLQAEVLALKARQADRHLTAQQMLNVRQALRDWPNMEVNMTMFNADDETQNFGLDLLTTFSALPGWSVQLQAVGTPAGPSGLGVTHPQGASRRDVEFAFALASALRAGEIRVVDGPRLPTNPGAMISGGKIWYTGIFNPVDPRYNPTHRRSQVEIEIGRKP